MMGIGTLSDLRRSRLVKRAMVICAIVFGLAVVYRVIWEVAVGIPQSRVYARTVQWAEDAERTLHLDPRFSEIRVAVPLRVKAFTGMSFFLAVSGVVLSEVDEVDLRSRLDALKPPGPLGWHVHSCFGDTQFFNSIRGNVEHASPP